MPSLSLGSAIRNNFTAFTEAMVIHTSQDRTALWVAVFSCKHHCSFEGPFKKDQLCYKSREPQVRGLHSIQLPGCSLFPQMTAPSSSFCTILIDAKPKPPNVAFLHGMMGECCLSRTGFADKEQWQTPAHENTQTGSWPRFGLEKLQ